MALAARVYEEEYDVYEPDEGIVADFVVRGKRTFASDEDVRSVSARVMAKHIGAFEKLASYDSN